MLARAGRRRQGGAVCACFIVGASLVGCEGSKEPRTSSAREASTSAVSPTRSAEAFEEAESKCDARQKRAVAAVSYPIERVVDQVTSSLRGASARASTNLRRLLGRAVERVTSDCQVAPVAMLRFQRTAHRLTRTPLGEARLERVIRAYVDWGGVVGASWRARRLEDKLALCGEYDADIEASYSVHAKATQYGKDMWVEWTLRNNTTKKVVVTQGGTLWARGVQPAYRVEWDRTRQAWRYTWGASSADPVSLVKPGGQVTLRGNVVLGYLPMRSDGMIIRVHPDLWVTPGGKGPQPYCQVPIYPAS